MRRVLREGNRCTIITDKSSGRTGVEPIVSAIEAIRIFRYSVLFRFCK